MKKIFSLFLIVLSVHLVRAQIITTVAGDGTGHGTSSGAYGGDFGPATAAKLCRPTGMAIDRDGNIYIADQANNRIRMVDTFGIIRTVIGGPYHGYGGDSGTMTSSLINNPNDVVVDRAGNLYFSDLSNHRVRRLSAAGFVVTVAGNGIAGYSGDGGPGTAAQLYSPTSLALDNAGNLYITQSQNYCVRKLSPSGIITTFAGNGISGYSGDGGPATAAKMNQPAGLAADTSGNIYVCDGSNQRVRKIAPSGIISTFAGNGIAGFSGDGGPATLAQLKAPLGVATDNNGNVYIADRLNGRVRKVTSAGIITTFAGIGGLSGYGGDGGPATAAGFSLPTDVWVDTSGRVYIVELYNHDVRRVSACHAPVLGAISGTGLVCPGANITLSNAIVGGIWQSGTPFIATVNSAGIVAGVTPGTAMISYTITNACNSATATRIVTVNPLANHGVISGPDNICPGDTAVLTESVAGGTWSNNDTFGSISGGIITGISIGTSTFSYAVTNSCGTTYATKTVSIDPPLTPNIIISTAYDTVSYFGEVVNFYTTVTFAGPAPGFQWLLNGVPVPGATSNSFSTPVENELDVSCIVTSSLRCVTRATDTSNIITISTGNLGIEDRSSVEGTKLFPNPNAGNFFLDGDLNVPACESLSYEIYNPMGEIVFRDKIVMRNTRPSTPININTDLPDGQYFIRLHSSNGSRLLHFIIRR